MVRMLSGINCGTSVSHAFHTGSHPTELCNGFLTFLIAKRSCRVGDRRDVLYVKVIYFLAELEYLKLLSKRPCRGGTIESAGHLFLLLRCSTRGCFLLPSRRWASPQAAPASTRSVIAQRVHGAAGSCAGTTAVNNKREDDPLLSSTATRRGGRRAVV